MRKYDIKNKRNIGIIIGISILTIIMFSLVIKLFLNTDRNEYQVSEGTLVFDKDKTIVKVKEPAIIKTKWDKKYYLIEKESNTELGDTAISYNDKTGEIHLYGRYYEISSGDEINITSGETVIKSTALTKFYKLSDRKYLVIDKEIKSADGLLTTTDFLLIDLDKVGNATLTNNKVNLKTFSATTIVTSNYTFDIANEILTYGSDKIDLKKIIGSSNTYTKDDLVPEESDNITGSNNGVSKIEETKKETKNEEKESNKQTDKQTNNGNSIENENSERNKVVIENIKKATKRTSVISVTSTTSKIVVDYVIYDPLKEYTSVYMEVKKEGSSKIDTIYLNNSDTTYELTNVFPNTAYELAFKYSYIDENNEEHVNTFDNVKVTTKKPNASIKVTRTSFGTIYYLISTDNSYNITSGLLTVLKNNEVISSNEVSISGNTTGSVYIPTLEEADAIELRLTNVKSNGTIIKDVTANYKFKY